MKQSNFTKVYSSFLPKPVEFFFISCLSQIASYGIAVATDQMWPTIIPPVLIHSILAFIFAHFLRLPRAWVIFNLLLPIAVFITIIREVPGWISLAILLVAICIYLPTFWTRVPYYPTSNEMYLAILNELPTKEPFRFIDLGSGFGPLLIYLAEQRPNGSFIGLEIGFLPYIISRLRSIPLRGRVKIIFKNFWSMNLGSFDFVYAFLAPGPMSELWKKAQAEMRSGSIFMTNTFVVPDTASKIVEVKDQKRSRLYIHKI